MRRAMHWIVPGTLCVALLLFGRADGQSVHMHTQASTVPVIDGIGLVDRHDAPTFKVGTWVEYRAEGSSLAGLVTEYGTTLTIGGEEVFWGDEGFWLETANSRPGQAPISLATFLSYSVFDPKLRDFPTPYFQRKTVMDVDEDGHPIQTILKRPTQGIIAKDKGKGVTLLIDTLGTETIRGPAGEFQCIKVRERQGTGITAELGDSTRYTERRETRTTYHSKKVPITGLVRTDIEVVEDSRTWKVGQSADVPMQLVDRATLRSELQAFGEGREAEVTPEPFRRPIRRARATVRR